MQSLEWLVSLREYVEQCRRELPIPDYQALSPEEQWQARIIGYSLNRWLHEMKYPYQFVPGILEPEAVSGADEERPLPAACQGSTIVIFETSLAGLCAGRAILSSTFENVLMLRKVESENWVVSHVELWRTIRSYQLTTFHSYFDEDSVRDYVERQAVSLGVDSQSLRLHNEGFALAPLIGRGMRHTYAWTGTSMNLLRAGTVMYRS